MKTGFTAYIQSNSFTQITDMIHKHSWVVNVKKNKKG